MLGGLDGGDGGRDGDGLVAAEEMAATEVDGGTTEHVPRRQRQQKGVPLD